MVDKARPSRCPSCGSARVARILYGLPAWDADLERALDSGRVVLGGCCVEPSSPAWQCRDCGEEWGHYWDPAFE
jgi:ribosomal protein L37AE/L43A